MSNSAPIVIYQLRIEKISADRNRLTKKRSMLAWFRFISIVLAVVSFIYLKPFGFLITVVATLACLGIFLRLVFLSSGNNEVIANLDLLLQINHQEIEIASGRYTGLPDGNEFMPPLHDFAQDLDIFGRASLYQYLNRTTSEQGRQAIAQAFLTAAEPDVIIERQLAAKDLAPQYEWRQQFEAHGLAAQITKKAEERVGIWLKSKDRFTSAYWQTLRFILPAIILIALIITLMGILKTPLFFGLAFIFFVVSGAISTKISPVYIYLDKIVKEVDTLSKSLAWIEQQPFNATLLKALQGRFISGPLKASEAVKHLSQILARMEKRIDPFVFPFLNTFLFWDLQQVLALEKWKNANKHEVLTWFSTLGEMEALSTIATAAFNHPAWCYPALSEEKGVFIAEDLGHPLIPESKRVTSSIATKGIPKLALITGSNMAGKSTFLRSVGINLVLAMMGAPACAKALTLSPMRVISSMRITDNLEENTSTFYAELKKLKHIIESVNRHEEVFLLLDEILRGTNSLDRQIGSKALIQQLIRQEAAGMLATHDLELAALSKDYPLAITNYYFDVQVANEELYFDYTLKEGVCNSLNASILMKKIGIEI